MKQVTKAKVTKKVVKGREKISTLLNQTPLLFPEQEKVYERSKKREKVANNTSTEIISNLYIGNSLSEFFESKRSQYRKYWVILDGATTKTQIRCLMMISKNVTCLPDCDHSYLRSVRKISTKNLDPKKKISHILQLLEKVKRKNVAVIGTDIVVF